MKYIKKFNILNEYFTQKEVIDLKNMTEPKYFKLIYDYYKDLENPSGKEVLVNLRYLANLFPGLEVKYIYPIFTLFMNNKELLIKLNFDFSSYKNGSPRDLRKDMDKFIKKYKERSIKNIPKDTDLERQVKSINSRVDKLQKVSSDNVFLNSLVTLLGDNNIEYLNNFYIVYLDKQDFDKINTIIENLKSVNPIFKDLKGDLSIVYKYEELEDYHRNALLDREIENLLKDNIFYKDKKNKSVIYKHVYNSLFRENIDTDYFNKNIKIDDTKAILDTLSTESDFVNFMKGIKEQDKTISNRNDLNEILKTLTNKDYKIALDKGEDFVIILSKSFAANKALTCTTTWCTANSYEQFKNYTLNNLDYYIFDFKANNNDESIIGLNFDLINKTLESITLKNSNEVSKSNWQIKIENKFNINLNSPTFITDKDIEEKILETYKKVDDETLNQYKDYFDNNGVSNSKFQRYYDFQFNFEDKGGFEKTMEYYGIIYDKNKKSIEANLDKKKIEYLIDNNIIIEHVIGNIII